MYLAWGITSDAIIIIVRVYLHLILVSGRKAPSYVFLYSWDISEYRDWGKNDLDIYAKEVGLKKRGRIVSTDK